MASVVGRQMSRSHPLVPNSGHVSSALALWRLASYSFALRERDLERGLPAPRSDETVSPSCNRNLLAILSCHPPQSGVSYMWEWADVGCLEQPHLHDVGPLYVPWRG